VRWTLAGALAGAALVGVLYEKLQGPFGLPPVSMDAAKGSRAA
jgi:CRISPR/Cas system-associated protein Csm6